MTREGTGAAGRPALRVGTELAEGLLRRRPDVVAVVAHGDRRGRELGFPTANLHVPGLRRRDGVYGGFVMLPDGSGHLAAISIGTRPTYWGKHGVRLLEAYLLDFNGDLYDSRLRVWLSRRLRGQITFTSESSLVAQMRADVQEVRQSTVHWSCFSPPST